nr:O-antigen ligase family protein [Nitrosomonas nitrosa]
MTAVDDLPSSVKHSSLGNPQTQRRRKIGLSTALSFSTGMFVQVSMPLTDLYEVPNARGMFFALVLGIFAFQFLSGKSVRIGSPLLMSYLMLSVVLAIGIAYSRAPMYGTTKLVLVCSYFWLLGTVTYNLVQDVENGKAFLAGLFFGGLLLVGIVAAEFGNPAQLLSNANRFYRLRFGGDGNPIMLARHLALAITIVIMYVAIRRKGLDWIWSIPLVLVTLAYLVGTGSKGPILALALSYILMGMIFLNGIVARLSLTLCIVSMVLLGALGGLEWLPRGFVEERFSDKVQNLSLRLPLYRDVVHVLFESDATSLLVGHGTGDFGYFALGHDGRDYPHNVLLEVAYENGLIGVSMLVMALAYPLVAVLRRAKRSLVYNHRVLLAGLSAIYVSSVINAQFTGDLGANLLIGMFGAATTSMSLSNSADGGT